MAIQHRRGADVDFKPDRMKAGELALTTDGTRKMYAAFAPGDVKEVAFKEDIPEGGGGGDIDLSGYATKEEVEELEQEIDDLNVDLADCDKVIFTDTFTVTSTERTKIYNLNLVKGRTYNIFMPKTIGYKGVRLIDGNKNGIDISDATDNRKEINYTFTASDDFFPYYLRIGTANELGTEYTTTLKDFTGVFNTVFDNLSNVLNDHKKSYNYVEIPLIFTDNKYIWTSNEIPQDVSGLRYGSIDVREGEKYIIQTCRNYDIKSYLIYGNGILIEYDMNGNTGFLNDVITIPSGGAKLYVNGFMPSNNAKYGYTKVFKLVEKTDIDIRLNVKWFAVGDSITDAYTLKQGDYWMPNYVEFTSQKLGIEVLNKGRSGTGYLNNDGSATTFAQRIATMTSDYNLVTIFGSFNDLFYEDYQLGTPSDTSNDFTVYGQIKKCIETIYSINQDCKIILATPTPWRNITGGAYTQTPNYNERAIAYTNAIKEVGKMYSIPVIDLFNESGLHPWDDAFRVGRYTNDDGTHGLSETHLKYITPLFVDSIKKVFNI